MVSQWRTFSPSIDSKHCTMPVVRIALYIWLLRMSSVVPTIIIHPLESTRCTTSVWLSRSSLDKAIDLRTPVETSVISVLDKQSVNDRTSTSAPMRSRRSSNRKTPIATTISFPTTRRRRTPFVMIPSSIFLTMSCWSSRYWPNVMTWPCSFGRTAKRRWRKRWSDVDWTKV